MSDPHLPGEMRLTSDICAPRKALTKAPRDATVTHRATPPRTNASNLGLVSPSDVVRVALADFVLKRYVGDKAHRRLSTRPNGVREARSMPVAPLSVGPAPAHSGLARWAVGLAGAVVVAIAASFAIFAVALAIGGSRATADNWVGFLGMVSLLGGLLASLAAFALAVVAKVKHERWALLWLPLSVFPALLAFLLLGEAFWWEEQRGACQPRSPAA